MQLPDSARLNRRTAHWIQLVTICLFALVFLMPACRDYRPTFNNKVDTYQGWECARLALMLTFNPGGYSGWGFLAVLSGWINPLTLLVFILSLANRLPRLRTLLAGAILVCLISNWVFFAVAGLVPLIGHFLWAASAAAILAADTLALPKQTLPS